MCYSQVLFALKMRLSFATSVSIFKSLDQLNNSRCFCIEFCELVPCAWTSNGENVSVVIFKLTLTNKQKMSSRILCIFICVHPDFHPVKKIHPWNQDLKVYTYLPKSLFLLFHEKVLKEKKLFSESRTETNCEIDAN